MAPTLSALVASKTFSEFWAQFITYDHHLWMGVFFYVWLEMVWFPCNFPWFVLDYLKLPFFEQYKIQPGADDNKKIKQPSTWEAVYHVLINIHLFTILPLVTFVLPRLVERWNFMGIETPCLLYSVEDLPTWSTIAAHVVVCFLAEDTVFYWGHRLLHTKPFYAMVHKKHHNYKAPYSWTSFYAHPLDIIFGNFVPFAAGLIVLWGRMHAVTLYIWLVARVVATTDVHCGYAFPWDLERFFPFYAGPRHHDTHHELFNYNFSSTNVFWDWAMGTGTHTRHAMAFDSEQDKALAKAAARKPVKGE